MSLDKDKFSKAHSAFHAHVGGFSESLEAAIETYLAELFKPGQLTMLEPIQPIQPARDYRKELWVEIACSKSSLVANQMLAEFDKTFPKEQP